MWLLLYYKVVSRVLQLYVIDKVFYVTFSALLECLGGCQGVAMQLLGCLIAGFLGVTTLVRSSM